MSDNKIGRRQFLKAAATGGAAGIAGCLGGDSSSTTQNDTKYNNTGPETGSGNETTPQGSKGGEDEEDLDLSSLMEDEHLGGEIKSEDEYEKYLSENWDGWIEFEDPDSQIPKDKLDVEKYPALEAFKRAQGTNEGPYKPSRDNNHQATYMPWVELGGKMGFNVATYFGEDGYDYGNVWQSPDNVDADIEGILRNVVQGVSDVSDLEPRYAEALLEPEEG
jgi:hypothetical protein